MTEPTPNKPFDFKTASAEEVLARFRTPESFFGINLKQFSNDQVRAIYNAHED